MSPGLMLNHEECLDVPDPCKKTYVHRQTSIRHIRQANHGLALIPPLQLQRSLHFVHPQVHHIGRHHLMEYLEGFPRFKLSYLRRTGLDPLALLILPTARLAAQRSAICAYTADHRFYGAPK